MTNEEYEINLLDYWRVIWKFRLLIICCFVAAIIGAGVISYRMPKVYVARTTILPPPTEAFFSGISYIVSPPLPLSETESPIYLPILKSETLAREVIKALNLTEKFSVTIQQMEGGVTEVKVESQNPTLAAEIANQYILVMKDMVKEYTLAYVRQNRQVIEARLKETEERLKSAEETIQKFRQTAGIKSALELSRLEREIHTQESVYLMLSQEYEKTRLAEVREIPAIQVLDVATPPLKPTKLNLRLNIIIAGVLSLFLSVFLAFFINYLQKLKPGFPR